MKRECLRLLANARSGDHLARQVVAEHYLKGTAGFSKHLKLGIEYLSHPTVSGLRETSLLISRSLSLTELVDLRRLSDLRSAAALSDSSALLKLAAWEAASDPSGVNVLPLLQRADGQNAPHAAAALRAWTASDSWIPAARLLSSLGHTGLIGAAPDVALRATRSAIKARDVEGTLHALHCSSLLAQAPDQKLARALCDSIKLAGELRQDWAVKLEPRYVQAALELLVSEGDVLATFILGRALCRLEWDHITSDRLVPDVNLRRGIAFLMRAADAGYRDAWMDLYNLHSQSRSSVGNASVALFCVEKAAAQGVVAAQRRLGVETLSRANSIRGLELGISWLHRASEQGDKPAGQLLESLVLRPEGDDRDAEAGIRLLHDRYPWLAVRLKVARHFGLTRSEALAFCPIAGSRPWGLVVDRNPMLAQPNLSSSRAVPATTTEARRSLAEASAMFSGKTIDDILSHQGALTQRNSELRRVLRRLCIDENLFFPKISASAALAMKIGTKWAHRNRRLIVTALSSRD